MIPDDDMISQDEWVWYAWASRSFHRDKQRNEFYTGKPIPYLMVGSAVGAVGMREGTLVGSLLGRSVGKREGRIVGPEDGCLLGRTVGALVYIYDTD